MHDPLLFLSVLLFAASVIGLSAYFGSVLRELRWARRETSRFPMFAARDRLIRLVASGAVSARDPGWAYTYRGVNGMLGLHQELHLLDLIARYASYIAAIRSDPELRRRAQRIGRLSDATSRKVPEFVVVLREIDQALTHLVARRTTRLHLVWLFLRVLLPTLSLKAFGAVAEATQPSSRSVNGWISIERPAC